MFIAYPRTVVNEINYTVNQCASCISSAFKVTGTYNAETKLYFKDTNGKTFGLKIYYQALSVFTDDRRQSSTLATLTSGIHHIGICMNLGNPGSIRVVVDSKEIWNWTGKTGEGAAVISWNIKGSSSAFSVQNFMIADFDIAGYMLAVPAADVLSNECLSDGKVAFTEPGKSLTQSVNMASLKSMVSVPNFDVKAVGLMGESMSVDSDKVNQVQTAINDITTETVSISSDAFTGAPVLVNPATNKAWTLSSLKNAKFKITTAKG